jgi:GNAT superfamily N-acetyltransferase
MMDLPPGHHLTIEDRPAPADVDALSHDLEAFNERRWPGHLPCQELAVFVRDQGDAVVGGLAGHTYAGWMFVQYLWLADRLRGAGLVRDLIEHAERIAIRRGCHSAYLGTFSFQARAFCEALGYTLFGTLDYPPGHQRYFLQKRLAAGDAAQCPSANISCNLNGQAQDACWRWQGCCDVDGG